MLTNLGAARASSLDTPPSESGEMVMESNNDEVSVERISTIFPATPTERHSMFLTSCDLVCRSYPYINRIFFFDCKDDYAAVVASLRDGLERALVHFFPLAGRFAVDDDGRLEVDCNDAGVDFVEAIAHVSFIDLQANGFQYRNLFWKLARRTELLRSDFVHRPILSVQLTKFQDGGLSIGISLSHTVADAQSFYDFVKSWSELCRGVPMTVAPEHIRPALKLESLFPQEPSFDDALLFLKRRVNGYSVKNGNVAQHGEKYLSVISEMKLKEEKHLANGDEHQQQRVEAFRPESLERATTVCKQQHEVVSAMKKNDRVAPIMEKQLEQEEHRTPRTDLIQKVFSFSGEVLQRLKKRAACDGKAGPFTTFEAFCAHWWKSLIRARNLPDEQSVFLLIPINCRQRFLSIPKGYFGNSLDGALVESTSGELLKAGLSTIAAKIHEAIIAVTEDTFRNYIKAAESRKNAIPHFDRTGLFHVVDSPKYPIYDTNFGWGTPVAVRAEGFRFGAEVQILTGRNGGGSMDLFCALSADAMKLLEQDPEFLSC